MRWQIAPRSEAVGGGWKMQIFDDDDVEIAGGVFPPGDDGYADAVNEVADLVLDHSQEAV